MSLGARLASATDDESVLFSGPPMAGEEVLVVPLGERARLALDAEEPGDEVPSGILQPELRT